MLHDEFLHPGEIKQTTAIAECEPGEVGEFGFLEYGDNFLQRHSGGIKHCGDRTGRYAGYDIRHKAGFVESLKHADMCEPARSSPAQSHA